MNADQFVTALKNEVAGHPAFNHPLMEWIESGDFSPQQLQTFSVQYYLCYGDFNRYLALIIPEIPDESMRIVMTKNLVDELGEFEIKNTHPELFRRFLRAIGVDDSPLAGVAPLPSVRAHVELHTMMCRNDLMRGLGTITPGTEWCVPNWFTRIVSGIQKRLRLSESDLAYWSLHIVLDIQHAAEGEDVLRFYATTPERQASIREGAMMSLDATNRMLTEIYESVANAEVVAH